MRKTVIRAAIGLAAATTAAVTAAPAYAAAGTDYNSGLTFYRGTTAVANVADPDGSCTSFPSTATLLVGWSNVEQVTAYRGADCTGTPIGLGTLRSFTAGEYRSYRAV